MLCTLQVRGSNAALSAAWNVTSYPTLLDCNGDPALAERYSGELKSERIASFLVRLHHKQRLTNSRRVSDVNACFNQAGPIAGVTSFEPCHRSRRAHQLSNSRMTESVYGV